MMKTGLMMMAEPLEPNPFPPGRDPQPPDWWDGEEDPYDEDD